MLRLLTIGLIAVCVWAVLSPSGILAAETITISSVEPTVFFPKVKSGEPLRQLVRLRIHNDGAPVEMKAKIAVPDAPALEESLGRVETGDTIHEIHVPDVDRPGELTVALYRQDETQPVDSKTVPWTPQKKWNVYCASYSHHDLGFGDYPHRLRTTIRHANIERPLQFCRETDSWDDDSKFRFNVETSEPITSFLGSHDEATAAELARRIREGRIQIGAALSTANTEQLGHECLARLFYLADRHTRDLLDVPAGKTLQIDDVIGLTWPLATFSAAADVPYLFHGHNSCGRCLLPAADEPVFYWQGPDAQSKILVRSMPYGGYSGDNVGDGSEKHIEEAIVKFTGPNWPYDAMLLQEGTDFQLVTRDSANKIHAWNAKWAYPRLICATMDMFFDAVVAQADPAKIKTFAKGGNNQWADQDANDAWLLGLARRQGEAIPTAEKLCTIAQTLGGAYPWTDIYQAYHRLLLYHEHTNAIDAIAPDPERMRRYETELEENREMVVEAAEFCDRARDGALSKLTDAIALEAEKNLVVFNPLSRPRTDVVCVPAQEWPKSSHTWKVIDSATGKEAVHQMLPDGDAALVAADVPAMGYKVFHLVENSANRAAPTRQTIGGKDEAPVLENRWYRVVFDPTTGAITSIRDKQLDVELVDQTAPHKFNEYLYEQYDSPEANVPAKWHRVASAELQRAAGPVADVVAVQSAPVGVDSMRQTVTLYHDLKRIDFRLDLVKSPSGRTCQSTNLDGKESMFIALPFAVPEGRFHHELPGGVAEPIRDQFVGSCTAFYATRHFADVSNADYGATLSSVDASLVEYGRPRSCPLLTYMDPFEKTMEYPDNSRMYLYLLNNMFATNVRWDQRGPVSFCYSIRSHQGDWQSGRADQFGWDVHNPLFARLVDGKRSGTLPASGISFLSVDKPNVACTTVKPAELNGAGMILRFVETRGVETQAVASLPLFGAIASACETDLVENDRSEPIDVREGSQIAFAIRPFGVKTIRVVFKPENNPVAVKEVQASAVSDTGVALAWEAPHTKVDRISHYRVYRDRQADFQPSLLNLVARPTATMHTDRPELHFGGWINNRLEPETTYYYRVAAVDRWNNQGPLSPAVAVTTLPSSRKNMPPLRVECLRAVVVSPIAPYNFVNLLFRTNCESDIAGYEVYRSTESGFTPGDSNRIGAVDVPAIAVKGAAAYGQTPIDYRVCDFDHVMYQDNDVQPNTTYYYRVCAVDRAGQKGPCSVEAHARTKE